MKNLINNKLGFTLVEMLVTMSLVTVLVSSGVVVSLKNINQQKANAAQDKLVSAMRQARSAAQAGKIDTSVCPIGQTSFDGWVLEVDADGAGYSIYGKCTSLATGDSLVYGAVRTDMPSGITISTAAPAVRFLPLGNGTDLGLSTSFDLSGFAVTRTVSVSQTGQIAINPTPTPTGGPVPTATRTPTPTSLPPTPTPTGQQIVVDGGFESGNLSAWIATTGVSVGGLDYKSGTKSVTIGGTDYVSQNIVNRGIVVGQTYTVTAYVKVTTITGSWGSPRLRVSRYADLGTSDFLEVSATNSTTAGTNGWQTLSGQVSFVNSDLSGAIYVGIKNFGFTGGVAIADDVSVVSGVVATPTPTLVVLPTATSVPATATPVVPPTATLTPSPIPPTATPTPGLTLSWYSTLDNLASLNTPSLGVVPSPQYFGSADFVAGGYLNGGLYAQSGTSTSYFTVGSAALSANSGAIEFRFKPAWNHTDGLSHKLVVVRNDSTNYMHLIKRTTNALEGTISSAGTLYTWSASSGNYAFSNGTWYLIRFEWDASKPLGSQIKVFINGVEPTHSDPAALWNSATFVSTSLTLRVPNYGEASHLANGYFDEFKIYKP